MQYYIVDVFSDKPFMGNPVAVVICPNELKACEMQQISTWFNLSETTFVTKIDAAQSTYKVRIFSPGGEMPFAGHPTLGTAAAIKKHIDYSEQKIIQDCPGGLIEIRFDTENDRVHLKSPNPILHSLSQPQISQLSHVLDLDATILSAAIVEVGPVWITALLSASEAIEKMQANLGAISVFADNLKATGIVLGAVQPDRETLKVRTFAPSVGVAEDPVCGSGNIALAFLRRQAKHSPQNYIAKQGQEIGRDGEVMMTYIGSTGIELGGKTKITATGHLIL